MTIYIIVLLAFLTHVGFAGSRLAVPLFAVDQGASPFVVGTIVALVREKGRIRPGPDDWR